MFEADGTDDFVERTGGKKPRVNLLILERFVVQLESRRDCGKISAVPLVRP